MHGPGALREVLIRLSSARYFSVRPTARGWQAIFFGGLALLAARLIGTTQFYQLAYALAGLFLVALVLGLFLSWGLEYERRIPVRERFVAGRTSNVDLVVRNTSKAWSPGVEVVDRLHKQRLLRMPPVGGSGMRTLHEPVSFARRGLYQLGPAQIRTTDPFGLLRFTRTFGEYQQEVVVYPKVYDLLGLPLRGQSMQTGARGTLARQGDEFSDLREYRRGDDRRHIHWKSVARTGELIVKEFAQNAPQRHAVVLDLHCASPPTSEIEVEDAVSAAGSVLRRLAGEGLPFRLLCADKERNATAFGADEADYWRAMNLLAVVRADGEIDIDAFLDEMLREGLGESVVLVARSLGEGFVRNVRKLRAAGLSVVVVALAVHTYRGLESSERTAAEAALSEDVRRLEFAGASVVVVRRPGGIAAFDGGQSRGAAGVRGVV